MSHQRIIGTSTYPWESRELKLELAGSPDQLETGADANFCVGICDVSAQCTAGRGGRTGRGK
jgi:hypothetical protein